MVKPFPHRFPLIDLKGGPFDLGLAHGRLLAREIRSNLATYLQMIRGFTGLKEERIMEVSRLFGPLIQATAPDIFEEMEGLAQGSGLSLERIILLNARTELVSADQLAGECTAVGLTPSRTWSSQPLLAQNWDWKPELKYASALFRLEPDDGPRALIFAEAGQVGKIGLNENGVGVLLNILKAEKGVGLGLPVHVLLRQMMAAADVTQIIDLIKDSRRASSSHVLLGDLSGRVVGVEFSPQGVAEIEARDGAVAHTNHFLDPELAKADINLSVFPDSPNRLRRAEALLSAQPKWSLEDLKTILSDHENGPASICRHLNPVDPEHRQMESVGSFIFDLAGRRILVATGQPCQNEYEMARL